MKAKNFILIVGNSGSGKTTVVEELEKRYGLKPIQSYTTRQPRYKGETGHIFVQHKDMPPHSEMVGYTLYNYQHYWATKQQVEDNDLYVIDPAGIQYFREHYDGDKPYLVIQIWAPEEICKQRMFARGDSEDAVKARLAYDKIAFANIDADVVVENTTTLNDCIEKIITHINMED
jgi:guanylate kinase